MKIFPIFWKLFLTVILLIMTYQLTKRKVYARNVAFIKHILFRHVLADSWRRVGDNLISSAKKYAYENPELYELVDDKIRLTDKAYKMVGMIRREIENYYSVEWNADIVDKLTEDNIDHWSNVRTNASKVGVVKLLVKIEPRRLVWFKLKYGEVTPVRYIETNDPALVDMLGN